MSGDFCDECARCGKVTPAIGCVATSFRLSEKASTFIKTLHFCSDQRHRLVDVANAP